MIIIGDISGIQTHLFDVSEAGGAQARQLRSRSFFMQMLVEIAALRVLQAAGWKPENLIFSGAGKFILQGGDLSDTQIERVKAETGELNLWLLREVSASLRFSVAVSRAEGTEAEQYDDAMKKLLRAKKQAWRGVASENGKWNLRNLILAPVGEVCDFCRRRNSFDTERDDETGEQRRICFICRQDREIGKRLPNARYALATPNNFPDAYHIGGWFAQVYDSLPNYSERDFVFSLEGRKEKGVLTRRLARHIPKDFQGKPIEFVEIAKSAKGDRLLGVLKMDGDSLGRHFGKLLEDAGNLQPFRNMAENLDEFFAVRLTEEIRKDVWKSAIYTVFAGGDDLLLVGAWDKIFEFAGQIQQMFAEKFGSQNLTISGGLAFIKAKRPIRFAAEEAEHLLEKAKTETAFGESQAKNQLAAFGQIWKWKHHAEILQTAKQIVRWIDGGEFKRGWLNTLLRLAEMREQVAFNEAHSIEEKIKRRRESQLAASRLAYFVGRNFPKVRHGDQAATEIRLWANNLIADFEKPSKTDTIYLPAIARYALTATRGISNEEE